MGWVGIIKKRAKPSLAFLLAGSSLLSGCAPVGKYVEPITPYVDPVKTEVVAKEDADGEPRNYCEPTPENLAQFPPEKASNLERILVNSSGVYMYAKNPELIITRLSHEVFGHSLAAVVAGTGVKEWSILPKKHSDESIRDSLNRYGSLGLGLCDEPRDYSDAALALNLYESFFRFRNSSGNSGYSIPNVGRTERTAFQSIAISLAPYVQDIAFIYTTRNSESLFFQMESGRRITAATGAAIFGLAKEEGDLAGVARIIWPPERYSGLHYSALRRAFAFGAGYLIVKVEAGLVGIDVDPLRVLRLGHFVPPF